MAVAHDAASESHTGATGSASEASFTWEHDPAGVDTIKGVLVFVINMSSGNDLINSVTYEGTTVPRITAAMARDIAGEPGRVDVFFLGSSVPQVGAGTATLLVDRLNLTDEMWAVCVTVTSGGDAELHEAGIAKLEGDGTLAEQSVTDGSPGTNSVRYAGGFSGLAAPPAAGGNSTLLHSFDTGNQVAAVVRETTAGQGSRSVGFSSGTSDDRAFSHFAIKELATGPTLVAATRAIRYEIRNFVSGQRALRYDVRNSISAQRAMRYEVRNLVAATRAIRYDLAGMVAATRGLRYDIRNVVSGQRGLRYDIRNVVSGQRGLRYDIVNRVSNQRGLRYDIRNVVSGQRGLRYDVRNSISGQRALRYDIVNRVSNQRGLRYDISAFVSATRNIVYDIGGTPPATTVPVRSRRWARQRTTEIDEHVGR